MMYNNTMENHAMTDTPDWWDENPTINDILPVEGELEDELDELIDNNGGITAAGYELLAQMDVDGYFV